MIKCVVRFSKAMSVLVLCSFIAYSTASADLLVSPHYEFENTDIGGGGLGISSSPDYQTVLSTGDNSVGNSSSTNFQIEAGANTTGNPVLAVDITSASGNFGAFSPTAASTTTTQFSVIDYTSYGYAVQITGNPPSDGGHTITAMSSTGTSSPGTEQFGINLATNTSPTSFGASPNDGQFGYGVAATNYNTANHYRYVNGDTIATSPKSSGLTVYTISYIVNVSNLTPAGDYTSNQSIICTATY